MAAYEDSYKSQLQGVSQQVARERLDGQVSAQDNMLSDTVTNLRRRPGAAFAYSLSIPNATADSILAWDTDLDGQKVNIILNTVDGVVRVLNSAYTLLATLPTSTYLTTSDTSTIQAATVGSEFFIANTSKIPVPSASTALNPNARGMFYIKAGAYGKTYEVKVQIIIAGVTYTGTATYTTPNGTGAGDAALSTPEYIAAQLMAGVAATTSIVTCYRDGAYVYLERLSSDSPAVTVSSTSGSNYIVTSGASYLRQETDLPARLPAQGDGYIMSTGEYKALRYYKYDKAKLAWLETGNYLSPSALTNVPVAITYDGTWSLTTTSFEGRFAGDDETNPLPEFVTRGITGIASYQGRLVLLAGSIVNMSASSKPRRFYRSTVTSILDSDPIEIGASAASSAAYRYAVPFQKDLLLFSEKYQAVVPGGNTAVTARTAAVVVTSTYEADMTSKPVTTGRTLMYPAARSKDFFGVLEMLASTTTDSQYTSFDSTAHLPKYMAGRCRFSVSSSVANMVLFGSTGDKNSLLVHEYMWEGDKKIQQAWHKWTFRYPVAAAYFSGQTVHVLFVKNGMLVACTIDPRQGVLTTAAERRPFLDMSVFADVVNGVVAYPSWISTFDPTALADLRLSVASGPLSGEPVGFTTTGMVMNTVRSFQNGRVAIGFPYRSTFSPTPPMMKDSNDVKISSNKLTILRFMVGTSNSAQYEVSVSDAATENLDEAVSDVGTLYFSSAELALGASRLGAESIAIVPCRTTAESTSLVIYTEGVGELNLISLEYAAKYHQKLQRARKQG